MNKATLELQREILDLKVQVAKLTTALGYWKRAAKFARENEGAHDI